MVTARLTDSAVERLQFAAMAYLPPDEIHLLELLVASWRGERLLVASLLARGERGPAMNAPCDACTEAGKKLTLETLPGA